uniref:CAZy families GH3 protein n=1 Tax=uncultured Mesorhizobium sp. TaxID=233795 RepID=A0A060CNB7_9HYPH|nr:CAZy families GH3 protein [uncultured Mesorhizobium sp.]
MVLHCNGVMEEMRAVAEKTPELTGRALERAEQALANLGAADATDEEVARNDFAQLFEAAA